MKIHYLITSLEAGGAEFAIPNIADALSSFGHELEITALEARDEGAAPCLKKSQIAYRSIFKYRQNIIKVIIKLIPIIMKDKPDVIWTSLNRATTVGQIVGTLLNIPVVSWKNSTNIRLSTRLTKKMSTLWIADSSFVSRALHTDLKIPPERLISWPLFVCQPHNSPRHYWDGKETLQLGSTGQLYSPKNYPRLIEALALFISRNPELSNKVHLSLAGDGPQREDLKKLIQKKKLSKHVSLLGFVHDVPSFLKGLHVYIQPSQYEGMCLAGHEAMAAGLPIIATPVGELSFSIRDGINGIVLKQDNDLVESISNSIENIFKNPSSLKKMGQNSQSYVLSQFSKEQYMDRCHKTLDKLSSLIHNI